MTNTTLTTSLRYLHITPRKTRRLADMVRGLSVNEAQARLMASSQRARDPMLKLFHSAIAGAKQKLQAESSQLYVKEIRVDQGPKTGRWMPRARGSASKVERKTSHITLTLGISDVIKTARFTMQEKPKKKKESTHKKHDKKVKEEHANEPHDEKKKVEKTSQETKREVTRTEKAGKKGFLRETFRRKSI